MRVYSFELVGFQRGVAQQDGVVKSLFSENIVSISLSFVFVFLWLFFSITFVRSRAFSLFSFSFGILQSALRLPHLMLVPMRLLVFQVSFEID